MRIGLVSTLATPVARDGGGSVEQIVWLLAREFTQRGHDVTVFACAGSEVDGELVATLPGPYGINGSPSDWQFCEWLNLCRAVAQSDHFDVLHSHSYLSGLPLEPLSSAPMLHTLHVWPHVVGAEILSTAPDAAITGISEAQWSEVPHARPMALIPHGVDPSAFPFRSDPEDYLCWLGRPVPGKDPRGAIRIARELGMRLILAGPHNAYFHEHVAPLLDSRKEEHVGWLAPERRAEVLGGARALLYPLTKPEPFGLVLAEAAMCGTPVLGSRLGAAVEIVEDGTTGYLRDDISDLAGLAPNAFTLPREQIRARALARFSGARMAEDYLAAYEALLAARGPGSVRLAAR